MSDYDDRVGDLLAAIDHLIRTRMTSTAPHFQHIAAWDGLYMAAERVKDERIELLKSEVRS